ncbi:MAG: mechanosensitive ion channel family protein, partial [Cyanobacteria bacterium P01_H01_bin.15]
LFPDRSCNSPQWELINGKGDREKVISLLKEIAEENALVLPHPKPFVYLVGFGDSSIDFELAIWFDKPFIRKQVISELNRSIWQRFKEFNIEIPFPQRDLHLRTQDLPLSFKQE